MTEVEQIGELARLLAAVDMRARSPFYAELAVAMADDLEVCALLLPAAPSDRYPYLLFAAARYLLGDEDPIERFGGYPGFRSFCLSHRAALEELTGRRFVQTNEVSRCAALMPCLSAVSEAARQPLAIIEIGCSAGLNLLFDRYQYDYDGAVVGGPSEVVIRPHVRSGRFPAPSIPVVGWRRGLDRSPVDITDDDAVRWLQSCIWPEQKDRSALLAKAVAAARESPPVLTAGDAIDDLPALVRSAPPGHAVCVMHTAVLGYVPEPSRLGAILKALAIERPIWWASGEPNGMVEAIPVPAYDATEVSFLFGWAAVGSGGHAVARAQPHGGWLDWL